MATLRITPSAYQLSNTSYLTITNPSNMYTNVDSTTYATVNHTRAATNSYYIYVRGFDFDKLPSNAIITSAIVKVKAYVSSASSATPGLYNGTSSLSKSFNGSIGTSTSTRTVDITSNWETYKDLGNNFGIRLQLNRSNRNTASKLYIYGAEIIVEYTIPIPHDVTTSATNCTITPSGTTTVYDGDNLTIKIEGDEKPTVIDNGIDVSSLLVEKQSTLDYTVEKANATYEFVMNSNGYYESTNKGKSSSTALSIVRMNLPVECTVKFKLINYAEDTYDYGLLSNVDATLSTSASADTSNVYWNGKNNNSASEQTVTYTIPSGEHSIYVKYFKDSYTDSNNDTLQFKVEITPNEPLAQNSYWEYTLTNINANHIIVATIIKNNPYVYIKESGKQQIYYLYKKINGHWTKQEDPSSILDPSKDYVVKTQL